MFIQGKLKLYPLWYLDQADHMNRSEISYPAFRKDNDISYQLIPASMLLTDAAYTAMNVSDSKEIKSIISSFKIDEDTLNSLLLSCHLPRFVQVIQLKMTLIVITFQERISGELPRMGRANRVTKLSWYTEWYLQDI